jgi:hypothetical protein
MIYVLKFTSFNKMLDLTNYLRSIHRSPIITKPLRSISKRYGENIYNRADDWDILIILDAAQYKIMNEISSDYSYIQSVDKIKSRGSHSSEWTYNTFIRDLEKYKSHISRTHYITGNIISTLVLEGLSDMRFLNDTVSQEMLTKNEADNDSKSSYINNLKSHHPVWKDVVSEENSYIPPELITDKSLDVFENMEKEDKAVLHYMQPHEPFVNAESPHMQNWPNSTDISMFNMSKDTYQKLLANYKDNHHFILEHLKKLICQIPNEKSIIISADHGNITNKVFGIPYTFGHPNHIFFSRDLRHVPWISVDQSQIEKEYENFEYNKVEKSIDYDARDLEEQLEDLGYM